MEFGTVKWFDDLKGYGFITPDNGGRDIFVHFSQVQMEGRKTLTDGQRVSYVSESGDRGRHATKVSPDSDPTNIR